MNMQEIIKRLSALSADEDRCKYCNSSTISGGDIYCSAGYSHDMNCGGKEFKLDYKIKEVISALEQQLTNESEIKRLQDEVESLRNWNTCEKEQYLDLLKSDKRRIELEEENEELRKQLTNGWIPVSERLPEENGHYLVAYHEWTDGNYLPKYDNTKVKILRYQDAIFKLPVCCDTQAEQDTHREVLAWRELPEPYKELATDNNVVTKSGKDNNALTFGDKIRESNESLPEFLSKKFVVCQDCDH